MAPTAIPTHESNRKTKRKKTQLTLADMPHVQSQPAQPPIVRVDVDMSGVEAELANLAHSLKSYVVNSYDGEHKLKVFTGPSGGGYHPVLLEFQGESQDALERIAVAFERIADSAAKFAGLTRPRLEPEQEE